MDEDYIIEETEESSGTLKKVAIGGGLLAAGALLYKGISWGCRKVGNAWDNHKEKRRFVAEEAAKRDEVG